MFTFWSVCAEDYKCDKAVTVVNPENALALSWHLFSNIANIKNNSCLPRYSSRVQQWSVRAWELLHLFSSLMHLDWMEPGLWKWPAPDVSSKGWRRVWWVSEQSDEPVLLYVQWEPPALQAGVYCEARIFVGGISLKFEFLTITAALTLVASWYILPLRHFFQHWVPLSNYVFRKKSIWFCWFESATFGSHCMSLPCCFKSQKELIRCLFTIPSFRRLYRVLC